MLINIKKNLVCISASIFGLFSLVGVSTAYADACSPYRLNAGLSATCVWATAGSAVDEGTKYHIEATTMDFAGNDYSGHTLSIVIDNVSVYWQLMGTGCNYRHICYDTVLAPGTHTIKAVDNSVYVPGWNGGGSLLESGTLTETVSSIIAPQSYPWLPAILNLIND